MNPEYQPKPRTELLAQHTLDAVNGCFYAEFTDIFKGSFEQYLLNRTVSGRNPIENFESGVRKLLDFRKAVLEKMVDIQEDRIIPAPPFPKR
jgi:hypothetical protein